jgi:hypothetical protein
MAVVCRSRSPGVVRKGSPVPAEVLFKRRAEMASVAANSGEAPTSCSDTCGGVLSKDQSPPVRDVVRGLRRAGARPSFVESQSVASVSRPVAYEFQSVAYESACRVSAFPAYEFCVASASQSTALGSAGAERPSSTLLLVLKSLVRRAAAAKVSRQWRRLEDASSKFVASRHRASVSRQVSLASVASSVASPEVPHSEAPLSVPRQSQVSGPQISVPRTRGLPRESLRRALLAD